MKYEEFIFQILIRMRNELLKSEMVSGNSELDYEKPEMNYKKYEMDYS